MDPNATLDEFRRLMAEAEKFSVLIDDQESAGRAAPAEWFEARDDLWADAAELMAGLDAWLSGGGFLPRAWSR